MRWGGGGGKSSVTRSGMFFYQIQLDGLGHPCFKDLQHLEQEGVFPPNLSSFCKKIAYMVTLGKRQGIVVGRVTKFCFKSRLSILLISIRSWGLK